MRLSSRRSRQQADGQALEDRHQGEQVAVDVAAPAADQIEHVRNLRQAGASVGGERSRTVASIEKERIRTVCGCDCLTPPNQVGCVLLGRIARYMGEHVTCCAGLRCVESPNPVPSEGYGIEDDVTNVAAAFLRQAYCGAGCFKECEREQARG